jgi:hypothetical protein
LILESKQEYLNKMREKLKMKLQKLMLSGCSSHEYYSRIDLEINCG